MNHQIDRETDGQNYNSNSVRLTTCAKNENGTKLVYRIDWKISRNWSKCDTNNLVHIQRRTCFIAHAVAMIILSVSLSVTLVIHA